MCFLFSRLIGRNYRERERAKIGLATKRWSTKGDKNSAATVDAGRSDRPIDQSHTHARTPKHQDGAETSRSPPPLLARRRHDRYESAEVSRREGLRKLRREIHPRLRQGQEVRLLQEQGLRVRGSGPALVLAVPPEEGRPRRDSGRGRGRADPPTKDPRGMHRSLGVQL